MEHNLRGEKKSHNHHHVLYHVSSVIDRNRKFLRFVLKIDAETFYCQRFAQSENIKLKRIIFINTDSTFVHDGILHKN